LEVESSKGRKEFFGKLLQIFASWVWGCKIDGFARVGDFSAGDESTADKKFGESLNKKKIITEHVGGFLFERGRERKGRGNERKSDKENKRERTRERERLKERERDLHKSLW
jgi:hypothetical protein